MKKLALYFMLLVFIGACSDTSTIPNASKYNIDELSSLPGYGWFYDEYEKYEVKAEAVEMIKNNFNPAVHKFLIYTRPSCTCPGEHIMFPAIYKILQAAEIPVEYMEFYSFSSVKSKHPYDSLITVAFLPAFYIMKSGEPIYSITDTLMHNNYYQITYPVLYEDLLYEGLIK